MVDESSLPVTKWFGDQNIYRWHGFWFMQRHLKAAQEVLNQFKPCSTDLILASFPKTGQTWLKSILYSIINRNSRSSILTKHPHFLVPTLEIDLYGAQARPFEAYASTTSPVRIFATHLPYQILADTLNSSDCSIVYVTRNPKDTLVSSWHFFKEARRNEEPWPLDDAVDKFCNDEFAFGSYYDHVLGYWKESLKRPNKIFFITYEELKNDPKTHVAKLAEFLGCCFEGDAELEEIVSNCSFDRMKNYEVNKSNEETPYMKFSLSSFFRQGSVGDYKNYLDDEMIRRIDNITRQRFLHGSGFHFGI